MGDLAGQRRDYALGGLDEEQAGDDPHLLFQRWYDEAGDLHEPNAMVVSTTDGTARSVLLKDFSEAGFTFFTHVDSAKGRALAADPTCGLLFPWYALERQIRIVGRAERLSGERYFSTRPRGSQLGAWAALEAGGQSAVVESRAALDAAYAAVEARFEGAPVPCPPGWGGYLVVPSSFEFWQGRTGRLHDRIRFDLAGDPGAPSWRRVRLAP